MTSELRKTGIRVVGDVPWGTHFCHFYETKQDLLDTLVPYFKAGLESKEFCLWVVSDSELITLEEARGALAQAVPDLDRHLTDGNIEILNGVDWYLEGNVFNLERVTSAWDTQLKRALARGYEGMRVSADTFWLAENDWQDFFAYEKQINDWITDQRMKVSCTYPLAKSGAAEVLDVVQAHQFAIARRQGEWEVIETPELIQAKAEIRKLNKELEQRVTERTQELANANAELHREIAERKRAEALLVSKELEFRAIVENAPDQIIRYDREFRRTYVNPEVLKVYGLPAEALIGRPIGSVIQDAGLNINEGELEHIRQLITAVFDTGELYEYEMNWPSPAGRKYYSVRYFPELDLNGLVVNVLGISRDITECKYAEVALRESENRWRTIFNDAAIGIALVNADGQPVQTNPALQTMLGYTQDELQRMAFAEFTHADDVANDLLLYKELSNGNRDFYQIEKRYIRKDEQVVWANLTVSRIHDEQGKWQFAVGMVEEITERKRAEEQLKATSEQLRALSANLQSAREEEGTRIARELHDELGGALTSLKWDLESFDRVISESGEQSNLRVLRGKIEAMLKLSETTIGAVRRISSELRPSVLDDLGLVEAIQWQARKFQARTGITCHCEYSIENVDLNQDQSTAVFRIFQEALTNILRHAQATRVNIAFKQEPGEIVLTVSDNGRGITDDEISRLQSLGLLGMRERALLIGAELDVTGVDGLGTVVTVRLPESKRFLRTDSLVE